MELVKDYTEFYFVFWTVHFHNWRKNTPKKCTN